MLFDAALAGEMAQKLLQRGVYLTAFSYPVVPKGQARIRVSKPATITFAYSKPMELVMSGSWEITMCQFAAQVQLSAAHTKEHLEKAISSFKEVGKELGVIV